MTGVDTLPVLQGSRYRGRSGWLQQFYRVLGRGKQEEALAIIAVNKATEPVGHRNTKLSVAMHRQQTAFIVHEPAL